MSLSSLKPLPLLLLLTTTTLLVLLQTPTPSHAHPTYRKLHDAHLLTTSHSFVPRLRETVSIRGIFGGLFGGKDEAVVSESPGVGSEDEGEVEKEEGLEGSVTPMPGVDVSDSSGEEEEDEDEEVESTPVAEEESEVTLESTTTPTPLSSLIFGFTSPHGKKKKKSGNIFGLGKSDGTSNTDGTKGVMGVSSTVAIVGGIAVVAAVIVVVGGVWMVVRRRRLREEGFEGMRRTEPGVYRAPPRTSGDERGDGAGFEIGDDTA